MCLLAFVGQELGPYWAHLGPFGLILGHFGPFSDMCRPLLLGHSASLTFRPCKASKIPGGCVGGRGACANPIFDLQNRRVQFWLRRPHTIFLCHTIFHIQLCHTHNFFLLLDPPPPSLSFLPSPSRYNICCLLFIIGRSWLVGLSGPLICVFVCLFLCSLLFWWHHTGLMLNHVEPFWVIFRYLLAFFLDLGISVLLSFGLVGFYFGLGHFSVVEFWSCHSLFWTWAFQCR